MSAENGDKFENGSLKKSEKVAIFEYFLTNFIGKKYQTCSKKIRFVSKADFCGGFG
uniref:hypothetical protein n=1 Tax=Acinetobacter soli TaxID=487316 RepID=UPI003F4968C2